MLRYSNICLLITMLLFCGKGVTSVVGPFKYEKRNNSKDSKLGSLRVVVLIQLFRLLCITHLRVATISRAHGVSPGCVRLLRLRLRLRDQRRLRGDGHRSVVELWIHIFAF